MLVVVKVVGVLDVNLDEDVDGNGKVDKGVHVTPITACNYY